MRAPLSWLLAAAGVDPSADPAEVARRLTAAGLEVESVEQVGHDIDGIVVAKVTAIEELTGFKKPVRYCRCAPAPGSAVPGSAVPGSLAPGSLAPGSAA